MMWLDSAGQDAVDQFWQLCGEPERFPRTLERSIALALPVALIKLPRLHLLGIEDWLRHRGIRFRFDCPNRSVRGCLLAYAGTGCIFVDGADPDDERRFTLAHEIAHFILDYWQPRLSAIKRLGPTIVDVLDGRRVPNTAERVYSLLATIPIGTHVNLMDRGAETGEVWKTEDRADRVALALLAPPDLVLSRSLITAPVFAERLTTVKHILNEEFGIPDPIAQWYGSALLSGIGRGPSWIEALRIRD